MAITAAQVKELRGITGAGMMDCKKALTECDGDIQRSIDWLREKGISKAAKKADRIAAEGLSKVVVKGDKACLVEINSETDFVAKNEQFLSLLDTVANALLDSNVSTMDEALKIEVNGKQLADVLVDTTATIGEKITLRRFEIMTKNTNDTFGSYVHMGGKISACVILKDVASDELAKDMAMQIASMSPQYVSRDHMPSEIVEHERSIQTEITKNDPQFEGKPEKVITGAIEGRVGKALQDMCLVDQVFFKNTSEKVKNILKDAKTEVISFVRYAVGEGIEKKEENFADEVAKQIK
ncbi:MAG: translation elongation factor Ts [Anaerorhabdus sp.]